MQTLKKFTALWISIKFIIHTGKSKYTKIITLATILGITLGITTLLTVMSIMNGFSYISKNRLVNLLPHITINLKEDYDNTVNQEELIYLKDYETSRTVKYLSQIINNELGKDKYINIYPAYTNKGLIINNQKLIPILINAVPTEELKHRLENLKTNKPVTVNNQGYINGIIISSKITDQLNNKNNISFANSDNLFKFYTADITNTFDATDPVLGDIALMDLKFAQQIFQDKALSSLNITLVNPNKAPIYSAQLLQEISYTINNWTQYIGNYFNILEYTKQIMFLLLSCIIIVAMFNAVATLTTTLNEKQTEIAILKTIGSDNFLISKIFLIYGFIVTTLGLILGVIGGCALSYNITYIANILESLLGYKFVDPKMYLIDFLPSKIDSADILNTIVFVYFVMIAALIYPILKAVKVNPAQSLKYS